MENKRLLGELLSRAIFEATGSVLVAKKKINIGEISITYDVELSNGQHIIAKTLLDGKQGYEIEDWCFKKLKNMDNLPMPKILLVRHVKVDGRILSICIQEKKEGESIKESRYFKSLDKESKKHIICQAGRILSEIHSIRVKGFGYINGNGVAAFGSFFDMLDFYFGDVIFVDIARRMGIQKRSVQVIADSVQCILARSKNIELFPVLSHNDYTLDHIIIDNRGKITAIIDWGEAQGNLPLNDFAKWDFWCSQFTPTEWLREGYTNIMINEDLYNDILHMMRCLIGIRAYTWYSNRRTRAAMLKKILFELDKDFRYLNGVRK